MDDPFTTTEIVQPLEVHVTSSGTWTSTIDCLGNGGALWIEGFLLQAWSQIQPTVVRSEQENDFATPNLCAGVDVANARGGLFVMKIIEELGLYPSYVSSRAVPRSRTFLGEQRAERPDRRTIPKKEVWLLELDMVETSSPNQFSVGDVFAKALPREQFEQCRDALGVRSSSTTSHQSAKLRFDSEIIMTEARIS